MSLVISPTSPTAVTGSSAVAQVAGVTRATVTGGLASSALALAFEQVDTGPLGLRKPAGAEDMAALLSEVEMELDDTSSKTRANSLESGLETRRVGLLAGAALLAQQQQAQAALAAAQTSLTQDQTSLANAQTDQAQASAESAQDSVELETLGAQVVGLNQQIVVAQTTNPNADVSSLVSQRDALTGQINQVQSEKDDADARVSSDATEIAALTNQVASDKAAVIQANATLTLDQALQSVVILSAFTKLAQTLQTGDGKFARNVTTSNNLDLGFDALNDAQSAFRAHNTQRTKSVAAETDASRKSDDSRRDDIRQVAAALTAGLTDVRAVLAELKAQSAPASGATDRVRLSL